MCLEYYKKIISINIYNIFYVLCIIFFPKVYSTIIYFLKYVVPTYIKYSTTVPLTYCNSILYWYTILLDTSDMIIESQ